MEKQLLKRAMLLSTLVFVGNTMNGNPHAVVGPVNRLMQVATTELAGKATISRLPDLGSLAGLVVNTVPKPFTVNSLEKGLATAGAGLAGILAVDNNARTAQLAAEATAKAAEATAKPGMMSWAYNAISSAATPVYNAVANNPYIAGSAALLTAAGASYYFLSKETAKPADKPAVPGQPDLVEVNVSPSASLIEKAKKMLVSKYGITAAGLATVVATAWYTGYMPNMTLPNMSFAEFSKYIGSLSIPTLSMPACTTPNLVAAAGLGAAGVAIVASNLNARVQPILKNELDKADFAAALKGLTKEQLATALTEITAAQEKLKKAVATSIEHMRAKDTSKDNAKKASEFFNVDTKCSVASYATTMKSFQAALSQTYSDTCNIIVPGKYVYASTLIFQSTMADYGFGKMVAAINAALAAAK